METCPPSCPEQQHRIIRQTEPYPPSSLSLLSNTKKYIILSPGNSRKPKIGCDHLAANHASLGIFVVLDSTCIERSPAHKDTLHFAAHIRLKVSPSMHARETSSQHRSSLYPLPLALGAAAVRLGEFDINPRWKPADDRLDLALINRAAASRSIDVGDLSGIHDRYISHLVAW